MPQRPPAGPRINRAIRVPEVRLIDEDGSQLGVVPTNQALEMARQRDLDLVEVAANAMPPVCKLLDYGRFKYEQTKKEREAKKHQHATELKELRLRPGTDDHDVDVRARSARRFIEEGHKVRLLVRFRGREAAHPEIARGQIDRIVKSLTDIAIVEQGPMMEGRAMFAVLARSRAAQAAAERAQQQQPRPADGRTQAAPAAAPAPAAASAPAAAPAPAAPAAPERSPS
ncbi:MAG: translation initiation factor IF-3 [Chloroflexota bacterium]